MIRQSGCRGQFVNVPVQVLIYEEGDILEHVEPAG
ncbi:hypothetical protein FOHLNKBM_5986 [Methylobacterium longum]|nr:hypothetical protein FOHLNKBM_5986 [Methylobacterium longum]